MHSSYDESERTFDEINVIDEHSIVPNNSDTVDKDVISFDRKISVSEAEQNSIDLKKEQKSNDNDKRNALPRDTSVEALASKYSNI